MCGITAGCGTRPDKDTDAEQEAAIVTTLLSTTEEYNAVWESLDFERISAYHGDDFTYYRRGVVDSASDFQMAFLENVATQITAYWSYASSISVDVLGQDAGIVAFLFRGGVETPGGAKHDYDGAPTYVFERRRGDWKIVHIHESAYLPK
jgi:ketosteroid isomerase-like protein